MGVHLEMMQMKSGFRKYPNSHGVKLEHLFAKKLMWGEMNKSSFKKRTLPGLSCDSHGDEIWETFVFQN